MNKGQISHFLRQAGLMHLVDRIRFYAQRFQHRKTNRAFKSANPGVKLPPDYLIYESFQINYDKYYTDGVETARWLAGHFSKHTGLKDKKILDWGCGPGRVIRHLPAVIGNGCSFYGTDYNERSIGWCADNLPGIQFNKNPLKAELPYADGFFDIIYGISIFTHLSEPMHADWYRELLRVLKPGGILFLTTQGDNFKDKLTDTELEQYGKGQLITRGRVKEGHRTYSAFHPKEFMLRLFAGSQVLEHIVAKPEQGKYPPQDIWILRKN